MAETGGSNGSDAASVDFSNLSSTWNDGATTFNGIKLNVTNTASASDSKLLDLQVGGVTKFRVDPFNGDLEFSSSISTGQAQIKVGGTNILKMYGSGWGNQPLHVLSLGGVNVVAGASLRWANQTFLYSSAANVIDQYNGVNGQAYHLYNTRTDENNYERGFMKWNSNALEIGAEAAGTGVVRAVRIPSAIVEITSLPTTDPTSAGQLWNDSGTLKVSAG